jgi:hypothetical protein
VADDGTTLPASSAVPTRSLTRWSPRKVTIGTCPPTRKTASKEARSTSARAGVFSTIAAWVGLAMNPREMRSLAE